MADDVDVRVATYTDWNFTVTWTDSNATAINLTGYTASLKLRTTPTATAALSLSVGSGITITAATGVIAIHATASQLGALATGTYYYDLILTSSGGVATQLYKGKMFLEGSISHA